MPLLLWQLKAAGEGRPGALTGMHPGLPVAERLLRLGSSQVSGKLLPGSENIGQHGIIPTGQLGMQGSQLRHPQPVRRVEPAGGWRDAGQHTSRLTGA